MSEQLHVFVAGDLAGTLERTSDGRLTFRYEPPYVSRRRAIPLSPSLPVTSKTFQSKVVEPFVEVVLPESAEVRRTWARKLNTSTGAFDLLEHMGLECPGAVQLSTSADPDDLKRSETHLPISRQQMAERLAARTLGLDVATTQIEEFDDQQAIVVQRYDRVAYSKGVARLHQVDMCQALSRMPGRKYESEGCPAVKDIASLVSNISTQRDADLEKFSRAVVFNYMAVCPDGPAKNYSLLLLDSGETKLAPLYDVATGIVYDQSDLDLQTVAMSLGGRRQLGSVDAKGWALHAKNARVSVDEVFESVRHVALHGVDAFAAAIEDLPAAHPELKDRLLPRLEAHMSEVAKAAGL